MDQKELMQLLEEAQNAPVSYVDLKMATQRIKVDMDTRKITGYTEFGVIKDHLAENIIFEVKRYKGDTDLAEKHCAIHWENGKNGGVVPVTEVDLSEDGLILMRWELSDEFTQYKGQIAYALHFFSILDGGFTYHAATNAASGTLGDTLNASAHSKNKITPSEIEVYIAKMNELSAAMDEQVVLAQEAAAKAESVAAQLAEKTGQIDLNTQKNSQHDSEIATLTQSKSPSIICQASGETIIATDSSDKGFEQFRTYGVSKQEKTSGKNLVPSISGTKTVSGVTYTLSDNGTFLVNGNATGYASVLGETVDATNLVGKTIVLLGPSVDDSGVVLQIRFTKADGTGNGTLTCNNKQRYVKTTVPVDTVTIRFEVYVREGDTASNVLIHPYCAIYDGVAISINDYEPYTGNIPSPNPKYPQPIVSAGQKLVDGVVSDVGISKKLTGKNLANINTSGNNVQVGDVIAGKSYTLCFVQDSATNFNLWIGKHDLVEHELAETKINTGVNAIANFTAEKSGTLHFNGWSTVNQRDFMLVEGTFSEFIPYEPYTEQTLTLNRVLLGIPVTDASLANYTDANGQMWCADYVDKARKVLVQRILEFTISKVKSLDSSGKLFAVSPINELLGCNGTKPPLLSDRYIAKSLTVARSEDYGITQYTKTVYIANKDWNFDLDTANADLTANPITVCGILTTPIETPLTDEEIIAYKTLHSNKPTTIITNDAGCFMEVEYVADTKTHIAQNYVPVSKYTALEERVSALEQLHV